MPRFGGWSIVLISFVFNSSIESTPETSVPYKWTIVHFYNNKKENTTLHISDNMNLSRQARAHSCDYELSHKPMYENDVGDLGGRVGIKIRLVCFWGLSHFTNLISNLKSDKTGQ